MSKTGAWGGWEKLIFKVTRCDPYVTLPYAYARAIAANICRTPIQLHNEWFESLWAGVGLQDDVLNSNGCGTTGGNCRANGGCGITGGYDRATVPTAYDLIPVSQLLRVYISDIRDSGKRILFVGARDQNGNGIYQQDVFNPVGGMFLTFQSPFVTSAFVVTSFTGIVKDRTYGDVVLKQVDENTGDEVFLARYGPSETNPSYRRYYLQGLPVQCCGCPPTDPQGTTTTQVTVMAKLDFVPAINPTDPLVIGCIPALEEECAAVRYSESDTPAAQQMAALKHQNALRFLREELGHYSGTENMAVNFAPFGQAHLERKLVGTMI